MLLLRFAFLVAGVLGYIRYSRHFDMVSRAVRALPEEMGELPKAAEASEQCYQDVLLRLYEEKVSLESGMRISRQEMQDYYSLWAHQIKTPLADMNSVSYTHLDVYKRQCLWSRWCSVPLFAAVWRLEIQRHWVRWA